MTQLNYLEGLKSIRLCMQNPHYEVGIFTRSMPLAELVYFDFIDAILEDDEARNSMKGYLSTTLNSRITFKNGSAIQFVRASEHARGCKFHHVLYDENIDRDVLFTVVKHTEFPYKERLDGR